MSQVHTELSYLILTVFILLLPLPPSDELSVTGYFHAYLSAPSFQVIHHPHERSA